MLLAYSAFADSCLKDGTEEGCTSGVKWHKFPWQSYILKDKITVQDTKERTNRFGLNYIQSMKIGVNRTIDDNRYVILLSTTVN